MNQNPFNPILAPRRNNKIKQKLAYLNLFSRGDCTEHNLCKLLAVKRSIADPADYFERWSHECHAKVIPKVIDVRNTTIMGKEKVGVDLDLS